MFTIYYNIFKELARNNFFNAQVSQSMNIDEQVLLHKSNVFKLAIKNIKFTYIIWSSIKF